ncbi:MAG: Exodeoxyribonuclease 7 large subunit [Elusimicrobia bacterium ADurb.Bin231]|nr:MAG: Exodeoxyribonuclease 7 large subunit [Elusimicrobia bacterium ADurb.Bin231]
MPKNESSDLGPLFDSHRNDRQDTLTISQLNNLIRDVLNSSFHQDVWVCGEIYRYDLDAVKSYSRPYGQVYFELVEQNGETKERKAAISAVLWGEDRKRIYEKLASAGSGLNLKDGLQIRAKCFVDFYPPQGKVQLRISDIDAEYTLGRMAIQKKLLLEKLLKTGLLDKNKGLKIPHAPMRIGLITSSDSAAYNDFADELKKSAYSFKVYICDARMQGPGLDTEVRKAIRIFNKSDVDLVAIIRGGGSASDLMGFDKEKVAVAIANSSKPIITGIGHQIDRTVADEVANMSFKTPTAAAQFIVGAVKLFEEQCENLFADITAGADAFFVQENSRLKNLSQEIKSQSMLFAQKLGQNIYRIQEKIIWLTESIFSGSYNNFDEWERFVNSKDPRNILKIGFSLLHGSDNRIIKSVDGMGIGENMAVELKDGSIRGVVTSKERI